MEGADPNGHSGPYGSAIYAAAAAGHINIVVLLLSRGAAVSARGPRGVTPLQVAAVEGHHEIVRLFLSKGVPVDERSRLYGTALLGAASRDRLDAVRVLLKHGADVNATGGHEPYKKALHASAAIGSIVLAKLLLDSGAEIDARGPNGCTALEMACQHGNTEVVRLLLERAAQPNPQSKKYGFEFRIARDRGHYNVVKLLLDFGASDELIGGAGQQQLLTPSPTNSPQEDVRLSDCTRVVDDQTSVNWPLAAKPLSPTPDPATRHQSQGTVYNSNGRQQSSTTAMDIPKMAASDQDNVPRVQSSGASQPWRFWKSRPDLMIQNRNPCSEQEYEERCGLFELYNQPSNAQSVVDIVAIHGLGGHWSKTWSGPSGSLWLRDFLPKQLQENGLQVRTLSYGYNSDTAFSKAVTNIEDEAAILLDRLFGARRSAEEQSRPMILIAHSLGGIIAKKAMIIAHNKSKLYGSLLARIHSVCFFGVPHRGSDSAYWGYFAARLLEFGQLGFGTNSTYVSALRRNSTTFANISQQFIDRGSMLYTIRTYYETERMGNQWIVDKDSAILGLPNEIAVGIAESNHRTMCKVDKVESQKYKQIGSAIQHLVQSALERPS